MPPMASSDPIRWYDHHAATVAERHEALRPDMVLAWAADLLPKGRPAILDVGAGSGRDSAWFAAQGADVVAVEPSAAMREEGRRRHPDHKVRWLDDALPGLPRASRLGIGFDLILLSAVWQHVAHSDRPRALRKLVALLKPGGLLLLTLRLGEPDPERVMHSVNADQVERLAREHGLAVVRSQEMTDLLGRPDVRWTGMALRLPDDGTGALPLLRHIILNDAKSSTYKLALLRSLCRIADGAAGLAQAGDEHVALPMGLVALTWLRLYLPLLRADLPQSSANRRSGEALGFAREGVQALLASGLSPLDLRVGNRFTGDLAHAVRSSLAEAAGTIATMPASHMTFPNGSPVLPVDKGRGLPHSGGELVLDEATLLVFGVMRVPRHLWQACQRFSCWVEPALVAEWGRLMNGYARRQDRRLDEGVLSAAMTWAEPLRDVALPRSLALRQLEAGQSLHCVWSGHRLRADSLDIDHCLPWAAWPCSDLWNLLPAHRSINQHKKRDRLPSDGLLGAAAERIFDWWQRAYLRDSVLLPKRFLIEAQASLPGLQDAGEAGMVREDVFAALRLQQLRLCHDQQVPEWAG